MSEKKDIQTSNDQLPAGIDFSTDVGGGMEGADRESFAVPFLRALQKMSPQVDEAQAEYVEGAKPGMLYNTVTGKLYDGKEGVLVLPCAYQRRFIRWAPQGEAASFKGEYTPEEVARMRETGEVQELDGKLYVPDSNGEVDDKKCDRMDDTRSHFMLVIDEDGASQAVMPLSSTQIKKSKQLMSILSSVKVKGPNGMVTPPTWSNLVRVTTVPESNDQGSWHGVKFTREGFTQEADLYQMGKAFHDAIDAGEAQVKYEEVDPSKGGAEADHEGTAGF